MVSLKDFTLCLLTEMKETKCTKMYAYVHWEAGTMFLSAFFVIFGNSKNPLPHVQPHLKAVLSLAVKLINALSWVYKLCIHSQVLQIKPTENEKHIKHLHSVGINYRQNANVYTRKVKSRTAISQQLDDNTTAQLLKCEAHHKFMQKHCSHEKFIKLEIWKPE